MLKPVPGEEFVKVPESLLYSDLKPWQQQVLLFIKSRYVRGNFIMNLFGSVGESVVNNCRIERARGQSQSKALRQLISELIRLGCIEVLREATRSRPALVTVHLDKVPTKTAEITDLVGQGAGSKWDTVPTQQTNLIGHGAQLDGHGAGSQLDTVPSRSDTVPSRSDMVPYQMGLGAVRKEKDPLRLQKDSKKDSLEDPVGSAAKSESQKEKSEPGETQENREPEIENREAEKNLIGLGHSISEPGEKQESGETPDPTPAIISRATGCIKEDIREPEPYSVLPPAPKTAEDKGEHNVANSYPLQNWFDLDQQIKDGSYESQLVKKLLQEYQFLPVTKDLAINVGKQLSLWLIGYEHSALLRIREKLSPRLLLPHPRRRTQPAPGTGQTSLTASPGLRKED